MRRSAAPAAVCMRSPFVVVCPLNEWPAAQTTTALLTTNLVKRKRKRADDDDADGGADVPAGGGNGSGAGAGPSGRGGSGPAPSGQQQQQQQHSNGNGAAAGRGGGGGGGKRGGGGGKAAAPGAGPGPGLGGPFPPSHYVASLEELRRHNFPLPRMCEETGQLLCPEGYTATRPAAVVPAAAVQAAEGAAGVGRGVGWGAAVRHACTAPLPPGVHCCAAVRMYRMPSLWIGLEGMDGTLGSCHAAHCSCCCPLACKGGELRRPG